MMDPDFTLAEIRKTVAKINAAQDADSLDMQELAGLAVTLAMLTEALDEWLTKSGYWPSAWLG